MLVFCRPERSSAGRLKGVAEFFGKVLSLRSLLVESSDPLVRAQGINRPRMGSRIAATQPNVSCTIPLASVRQILMGAPIGCPTRQCKSALSICQNDNLSRGTRKNRTRGSVTSADEIASC
jgi:hypothetical protein